MPKVLDQPTREEDAAVATPTENATTTSLAEDEIVAAANPTDDIALPTVPHTENIASPAVHPTENIASKLIVAFRICEVSVSASVVACRIREVSFRIAYASHFAVDCGYQLIV